MKRRWILAVIGANLIGLGALTVLWPNFMIAPGKLASGHTELATDCFSCHTPFRGASAQNCITCHAVATIGVLTSKGANITSPIAKVAFHQKLKTQSCLSCHTGHEGSAVALGHPRTFSHALLLPSAGAQCATCHTAPDTTAHRGANANCGQCHSQQAWKPADFDHAKFFLLEGPHATPCATCHVNNDTSRYTCFGCHEHQPDAIRAKHVREGISNFENCVQCHKSTRGGHGEGRSGERRSGERRSGQRGHDD